MKILIADDEKKICTLIKSLIDWEAHGLTLAGTANNGMEAYELALKEDVDIVITDIRMPGLDGIGLIEKMKEAGSHAEFIMVSGYKQFEYAHSAMRFGVQSYLLKPIDKIELNEALKKTVDKMVKSRSDHSTRHKKKLQSHFVDTMMLRKERTFMALEQINSQYELEFEDGIFQALFLRVDSDQKSEVDLEHILNLLEAEIENMLTESHLEFINYRMYGGIITVLNYPLPSVERDGPDLTKLFVRLLGIVDKFSDLKLTLGIGAKTHNINQVYYSIKTSMDAVRLRGILGHNRIIRLSELNPEEKGPESSEVDEQYLLLSGALETANKDRLLEAFNKLIQIHEKAFVQSPFLLIKVLEEVKETILLKLHEMKMSDELIASYDMDTDRCSMNSDSKVGMLHNMRRILSSLIDRIKDEKSKQERKPVQEAKLYIEGHYRQGLTLEEVAEEIGLSSSYLSTIFKNETGVRFSEYITDCRMKKAKDLLRNTKLSMIQVADQVGYKDQKYFSKTFKKEVGIKPSVFRKLYQGGA